MSDADYARVRRAFDEDAAEIYPIERFSQPAASRDLMRRAFARVAPEISGPARVVEAGCGNGYWSASLAGWPPWSGIELEIEGFDLSEPLIALARTRPDTPRCRFVWRVGNVLDHRPRAPADVVFAFDVLQHVPPGDRPRAVANLVAMLRPGGFLILADNDNWAPDALRMRLRKWLTRHTPLQLVPANYLLARYPSFRRLRAAVEASGGELLPPLVRAAGAGAKRAAIYRRPAAR